MILVHRRFKNDDCFGDSLEALKIPALSTPNVNMKASCVVETAIKHPPDMFDNSRNDPLPGPIPENRCTKFDSISGDFFLLNSVVKCDFDGLLVRHDEPFTVRLVSGNLGPNICFNGYSIWMQRIEPVLDDFKYSRMLQRVRREVDYNHFQLHPDGNAFLEIVGLGSIEGGKVTTREPEEGEIRKLLAKSLRDEMGQKRRIKRALVFVVDKH